MPSIFSRSRTTSTPNKKALLAAPQESSPLDEFGRISKFSNFRPTSPSPNSKKDKKKAKEQEKRFRTHSSARDRPEYEQGPDVPPPIPDGSFLPLSLERPSNGSPVDESKEHDYGYLSYQRHVVLGLEQVARLVIVISDELTTRGGITTPFIFSTTALDISSSAIKRLIARFLDTCVHHSGQGAADAEARWRDEARFAGPHELGMCLRWGLARVIRSVGGQDVRGLISWERYVEFRDSEAALGYPPAHFSTLLPDLPPTLQTVLISLLSLLSRLTANSTSSGHTPPTLSPLFGPLIFGLGPATLAFHHTYVHYLRAVAAMEHLQLAFIRWQDCPRTPGESGVTGSAAALGVPTRLKEWIKGYPAMLPFSQDPSRSQKPEARRGVRTVRVMTVRRNVRMYSPDLVKSAASWAHRSALAGPSQNGLAVSKEWARIAPPTLKLHPRYSEVYKKRMNMLPSFHPDTGPGNAQSSGMTNTSSTSSYTSTLTTSTGESDYFGLGLGAREGEDRFRSLTDLKWGEFESMGFSQLEDGKKLQFDLTESARSERSVKRETLTWNDFSSSGFSRSDGPLSATLQFSQPIAKTVSSWPAQNADLSKKLKKTQKALPPFGWDTEPVIGNEEIIEEAFVDVFCDLIYGGGWMDLERYEELDKDCNWALVEFKSLPPNRTTASGGSDPRIATTLILFEEFVPLEYRQQLAVTSTTRRRLPSLFTPSKSKTWKQASTLNGRPYIVGNVPRSPTYRELEFEGMLQGGNSTKVIHLGSKPSIKAPATSKSAPNAPEPPSRIAISSPLYVSVPETQPRSKSAEPPSDLSADQTNSPTTLSNKRSSRFRFPASIPVPGSVNRRAGMVPAEYSSVDFETRLASYSDEERNGTPESETAKQERRMSKDDAWVDILVGSQSRRMAGQDASRPRLHSRRSDPDMASLEVAQVLAGVRERSTSIPSVQHDRVDRDPRGGLDHLHDHLQDLDVDEIETVPRTSEATSEYTADHSADYGIDNTGADDDVDPVRPIKTQRRLGYFDLHPERRPGAKQPSPDDPRPLPATETDGVGDAEEETGNHVPTPRKLPVPPERKPVIPPAKSESEPKAASEPAQSNGNGVHDAAPAPTSKTAALIEMYRERERGVSPKPGNTPAQIPVAPLQPSRLPVRSHSLAKDGATTPPSNETPARPPGSPPDPILAEPPRPALEDTGRASPARYVHGAPLHNVLEEDEEEP